MHVLTERVLKIEHTLSFTFIQNIFFHVKHVLYSVITIE